MVPILGALAPVFLVIALGVVLRRSLLREPAHWVALERLTYFVLFPALLVVSALKADLSKVNILAVAASLGGAIVILSGLVVAFERPIRQRLDVTGPAFTSLFQGAVRWNTYIVLAVAGGLYGSTGITIVALALVLMIPLVNVISVIVLATYAGSHPPTVRYVAGQLMRNPYISACLAGAVLNAWQVPVPAVIVEFGDILGRASLAVGLLVVGGGLMLDQLVRPKPIVLAAVVLKLMAKPLLALGLGLMFGLRGAELVVVAIAAAVPSAPNAYVLARQMGGDGPLMAEILTVQILAAALTLPAIVALATAVA